MAAEGKEVTEGNHRFPSVRNFATAAPAFCERRVAPFVEGAGAAGPTRTDDLTLTKRLLYQLSYSGFFEGLRDDT